MIKGDAFNRQEVGSRYVSPKDRYVVSLVVGFEAGQVDSPQAAAASMMSMFKEERGQLHVFVHDRETGETTELTTEQVRILTSIPPAQT